MQVRIFLLLPTMLARAVSGRFRPMRAEVPYWDLQV
jgi:hypothetical protein